MLDRIAASLDLMADSGAKREGGRCQPKPYRRAAFRTLAATCTLVIAVVVIGITDALRVARSGVSLEAIAARATGNATLVTELTGTTHLHTRLHTVTLKSAQCDLADHDGNDIMFASTVHSINVMPGDSALHASLEFRVVSFVALQNLLTSLMVSSAPSLPAGACSLDLDVLLFRHFSWPFR